MTKLSMYSTAELEAELQKRKFQSEVLKVLKEIEEQAAAVTNISVDIDLEYPTSKTITFDFNGGA